MKGKQKSTWDRDTNWGEKENVKIEAQDMKQNSRMKGKKRNTEVNVLPCKAISAASRNSRSTSKPADLNSASLAWRWHTKHTLQVSETAPPTRLSTHTAIWVHLHVSRVLVSAAGVGDDVEVALIRLRHNEVIHDASLLIGEEGQGTLGG